MSINSVFNLSKDSSGIYQIKNVLNNKIYIGSSSNVKKRHDSHKRALISNKHKNSRLQNSWNKYGEAAFEFEILITCDPSMCIWYEQQFIDQWKPEYNLSPTAGSCLGVKNSDEVKRKRSKILIGNKRTLGYKHTEESKRKISEAGKTRVLTDLARLHHKEAGIKQRGRKLTEEHRKKLCGYLRVKLAHVGKKVMSPEGEVFTIENLNQFCKEIKVDASSFSKMLRGIRKSAGGWKICL